MNSKEKRIIRKFAESLPRMSDFRKGYIAGFCDMKIMEKEGREDDKRADGSAVTCGEDQQVDG